MRFLNTLNRVVIVVLCLVLMVVFTAVLIVPQAVLTPIGQWMVDWGNYFQRQGTWPRLAIGIAIAVVVDLVLALIIFLEVRRMRRRFIRVQQVAGGMATVSTDSVKQLLKHKLDPLAGIIDVDPYVEATGNKASVRVEVGVTQGTNVPQIATQVIKATQEALTDELGLQIAGQPEVRVTVVREKGKAEAAPPPPPTSYRAEPAAEERAAPPPLPEAVVEVSEEEGPEESEEEQATGETHET
ncbi:MAG: alkaline shock response membrane anchor protein AmaP [Anaerolineae bacterium]